MLDEIVAAAPGFFLVAVRALALIETAPLLSSDAIPQVAKVALAGFAAYAAYPIVQTSAYSGDSFTLVFAAMVLGEALIGIIIGFFISIALSAFASAGQLFSLQMGFGASETYDPLAQIENPLMGQYLNLIAMLVFLTVGGFQQLFIGGFQRSLEALSAARLLTAREGFLRLLTTGLSDLMVDSLLIAMPILGTLFLVSVAMGLMTKAAPQMNLLTEGFSISITIAFVLILATMPFLVESFARVIAAGFAKLDAAWAAVGGVP
jgi:flagellar biosynthetic protein FliR